MTEKKKYRIGVIGAGMIARTHIQNFLKTGRAEVTWIAARNPDNLERVRAEFAIPHKSQRYHDILEDPEVDLVVITTPPHLHREMFIEAVRASKHVLLEKPMTLNREEIGEMVRVKKQHPETLAMECSGRHARLIPKFRKVKEIIDSGVLGEIYYMHHNCVWRQNRPGIEFHPGAKWFLDKSQAGGGPLFDWGVYDLSFHLGILGDTHELVEVESALLKSDLDEVDPETDIYDVEEHFVVNMWLSGGLKYFWERGAHANVEVPNETRIYGTRGGIRLGYCSWDDPVITVYGLDHENKATREQITLDYSEQDDGLELTRHVVRVLDGEEDPVITMDQAQKHMEIIFRCYETARQSS